MGRLLIILLLCENGILTEPILYLSLYLKQHRAVYYNLLQQVRLNGTWETWLEFFLDGVYNSAKSAMETIKEINTLFHDDLLKIESLGRAQFSCIQIFEYFKRLPQASAPLLSKELGISAPTARNALKSLITLGVLEEISGKRRDKVYIYRRYLDILEKGTDPLSP